GPGGARDLGPARKRAPPARRVGAGGARGPPHRPGAPATHGPGMAQPRALPSHGGTPPGGPHTQGEGAGPEPRLPSAFIRESSANGFSLEPVEPRGKKPTPGPSRIRPMSDPAPRPADADRNLLFGILALQMDFIGRDALIAAMHAWVLDKAKP